MCTKCVFCMQSAAERKMNLKKESNQVAKALVMLVQITITMLAPILICCAAGVWLNRKFDTTICFLFMMVLGILASFRNFYHLVRGFYEKDLKQENVQQEYFDSMKRERESGQKKD